jgi:type I restriction enzyme, S subunit
MSFEVATLGEYATVQGGYAYKSQDFKPVGDWAVLKIKNIRNGYVAYEETSFVSDEVAAGTSKWATAPGDILVSMTGSGPSAPDSLVGRVARVWKREQSALINQRVGRLILKDPKKMDLDFLFYVLSLKESQDFLVSNATGSANQVNISAKTIESLPCPKVNRGTSAEIASILLAFDEKIRLLGETNTTLEAIAQVLFKSWFVDFDPIQAKIAGREPEGMDAETAALFPDSFEESELALVPKGWVSSTVGQSFILTMGQSPPGETYNNVGDGLPFFQGRTDFGFRFPARRIYCSAPTRLAEIGDTLVSVRAPVGDVNSALEKCAIGRGVAGVRHSEGHQSFVFYTIRYLRPLFENYNGEGTIFGSINKKEFQNLPIVLPDASVLREFEAVVAPLDAAIENNEKMLRIFTELRDTLLPRLIFGQLRIAEVEEQIAAALA